MRRAITGIISSSNASPYIVATGGIMSRQGDYIVHTFPTNNDFFQIISPGTSPNNVYDVELIGGGASGGSIGGGAAGRYRYLTGLSAVKGAYAVQAGVGGPQQSNRLVHGNNGTAAIFDTYSADGGGGGGAMSGSGDENGRNGGSGGGGGCLASAPYTGGAKGTTTGGGNNGGDAFILAGGGGGGDQAAGADGIVNQAGAGGDGVTSPIDGLKKAAGGGGGGQIAGANGGSSNTGGRGYSYNGGGVPVASTSPLVDSGSGGAGGYFSLDLGTAGANGPVKVKYYNPIAAAISTHYLAYAGVLPNGQVAWPWRDGLGLIEFTGKLLINGGWSDAGSFAPNVSTNEIIKSVNGGSVWAAPTVGAFFRRHSFGCLVTRGKSWIFGGDLFYNGIAPKDMWNSTDGEAYTNVTNDWGAAGGLRVLFASCVHGTEILMGGGQTDYGATPTMFTDLCKWNFLTNQFDYYCDLPVGVNFSTGIMISDGTNVYIYGGGQYNSGGHTNFNTNLYRLNSDLTWTLMFALPAAFNGLMYCNGADFDGKFWFLNGSTATTNQAGLWYTPNFGEDWFSTAIIPPARHASGICVSEDGNKLYIATGNTVNDVICITKTNY